jgi:hypothetical protein
MLPQTKCRLGHVLEAVGVMVLEVNRVAVDVQRSTTASPKLQNLLWRKHMLRRIRSRVMLPLKRQAPLTVSILRPAFRLVKTVGRP